MAQEKLLDLTKLESGFSLKTTLVAGSIVCFTASRIVVPAWKMEFFSSIFCNFPRKETYDQISQVAVYMLTHVGFSV